ncbi:MAG: transcriptional repressor [Bacteroidales bacterium]|nr:transcriptional repressor [Bacteroidales bacterium]
MSAEIEGLLVEAGIRVTAIRLLVLRTIRDEVEGVFSLADLGEKLSSVDESTLFRTLTLFSERHLVHNVDDGSGVAKYCVCRCEKHDHTHGHIHLTCTRCHRTYCLTGVMIPAVALPSGFVAEEAEYVVKGCCPHCAGR